MSDEYKDHSDPPPPSYPPDLGDVANELESTNVLLESIALELLIANLYREVHYWATAECGVPNTWLTAAEASLAAAILRRVQS